MAVIPETARTSTTARGPACGCKFMAVGDRVSSKQDGERDGRREILSLLNIVYRVGLGAVFIVVRDGCQEFGKYRLASDKSTCCPYNRCAPLSTVSRSVTAAVHFKVTSMDAVSGSADPMGGSGENHRMSFSIRCKDVGLLRDTVSTPPVASLGYRCLGTTRTRRRRPAWEQRGRDQWWWKRVRWHRTGWVLKEGGWVGLERRTVLRNRRGRRWPKKWTSFEVETWRDAKARNMV